MAFNTVAAYQQEAKQLQTYPSGYQAIYCDIGYQGGVVTNPFRFSIRFNILSRVI